MQIGIVVELNEGLERDVETLAVVEQRAVVIGNPPWTGIDVESLFELASLRDAAELRKPVAAAQGPVASARARVEFEHSHAVAGLAQLERRGHAGQSCAEDQDRRTLGVAFKP